jgi:signal transduction histidine kinase
MIVETSRLGALARALQSPHDPETVARLAADTAAEADALLQQRQMEDEFLSLMSHELRTPLTSIRGYAQLTIRQAKTPELAPLRSNLDTIMQQADRMTALTDVLLDVARIRTGRMALHRTTIDLGQVVRGVAEELRGAPESPPVEVVSPDGGPLIHADIARVGQIVQAFVAYAAGRTGEGQRLVIRVAVEGDTARLEVEDEGDVLARDERRRLFDHLVELAEDGHARSMGNVKLHIARGVIHAHGGRADVASPVPDADTGTRLTAWLPLHAPT